MTPSRSIFDMDVKEQHTWMYLRGAGRGYRAALSAIGDNVNVLDTGLVTLTL